MFIKKRQAFTLAEMLITLVIIGVVAAMTVPSLFPQTQDREYISKLRKTHSTLSQAATMTIAVQGSPTMWNVNENSLYNVYRKRLNLTKDCGTSTGCFPQFSSVDTISLNNNSWLVPAAVAVPGGHVEPPPTPPDPADDPSVDPVDTPSNAITISSNWETDTSVNKLILSDGAQVMFQFTSSSCDTTINGSNNVCSILGVDINGAAKPNKKGKDVFAFVLKENGLYPLGCDDNSACSTEKLACTCKVLREGKTIK